MCLHPYKRYHLEEYGICQHYQKSTLTVHSFLSNYLPSRILRNFASIMMIAKSRETKVDGLYNKEKLYSEVSLLFCYLPSADGASFGLWDEPLCLLGIWRHLAPSNLLSELLRGYFCVGFCACCVVIGLILFANQVMGWQQVCMRTCLRDD